MALEFDGTDDDVEVADSADFDFGTGDFSISLWLKFGAATAAMNIVTRALSSGTYAGFALYTTGTVRIQFWPYNGGGNYVTSNNLTANVWYHVAAVRRSGTAYIYIDANEDHSAANSVNVDNNLATQIADPVSGWSTAHGDFTLEDLRIYNRGLTAVEVDMLHRARLKRPGGQLASGLVLHMEFDGEPSGNSADTDTVADRSGNGNDGTATGGTWRSNQQIAVA